MYTPTLKTSELYHLSFNQSDFIRDVFDRLDDVESLDEVDDAIFEAIDESLTYTADQWKLLETYCTPDNADLNEAIDDLYGDCMNYIEWEECDE